MLLAKWTSRWCDDELGNSGWRVGKKPPGGVKAEEYQALL
jgi:hypothetical protein